MIHTEDDSDEEHASSFVLYSLRNHHLVKRLPLSGPPSTFTANDQLIVVVSHPIRLATNLLICIGRAWVHHLLYSFFHLQGSRLCILYHHCHSSRSRLYLIIVHLPLPLLLPPLFPPSWVLKHCLARYLQLDLQIFQAIMYHYLLTAFLLTHPAVIIIDDGGDAILTNLNPFSHSLIVFSLMPHHRPLHPHKACHPTNDSHQLHQLLQIRILVYPLHHLRLV